MADFHEVRFPEEISVGAVGGPGFKTTVLTLASGKEKRNINWSVARGQWDVAYGVKYDTEFEEIRNFFYARRGKAYGFRFKDWADFKLTSQTIGTTDGTKSTFQIFKQYGDSASYYNRTLNKIVTGTDTVWVGGLLISRGTGAGQYQINYNTGIITLGSSIRTAGKLVQVACEFDVPVRFDVDELQATLEHYNINSWGSIVLVELKL